MQQSSESYSMIGVASKDMPNDTACIANTHTTCINLALVCNLLLLCFEFQAALATFDSTIF